VRKQGVYWEWWWFGNKEGNTRMTTGGDGSSLMVWHKLEQREEE